MISGNHRQRTGCAQGCMQAACASSAVGQAGRCAGGCAQADFRIGRCTDRCRLSLKEACTLMLPCLTHMQQQRKAVTCMHPASKGCLACHGRLVRTRHVRLCPSLHLTHAAGPLGHPSYVATHMNHKFHMNGRDRHGILPHMSMLAQCTNTH